MAMSKIKKKPHNEKSDIKKYLEEAAAKASELENNYFLISYRHLDKSQGDSFYNWEQQGMLARAMDVLSDYCKSPLNQQFSDKFTCYGAYPSAKSGYKCPSYVPEDANWARIHVTGTQVLAGHIVDNVFYVVFLDPDHSFYKTDIQDR
jgi:hypothetical protein